MAFDGVTVAHLAHELQHGLIGGRIEKIYQPEHDEIILSIKNQRQAYKLLMTSNAQAPRIHLTGITKENPAKAPLFCMVLRKHLLNGRVLSVTQPDFDRVIEITAESVNEMGDLSEKTLIIEIMGKHSNIILRGANGDIIDSVKRVTHETSSLREVLPGKAYLPPPSQNKYNPVGETLAGFSEKLSNQPNAQIQKFIYTTYTGVSPITSSEVAHRAGVNPSTVVSGLSQSDISAVFNAFSEIINDAVTGNFSGELVFDEHGKPLDFAPFALTVFGSNQRERFESASLMTERFYAGKDARFRISQKAQDLRRLVAANIERCVKKHDMYQKTLKETENKDINRLYGELINANIHLAQKGAGTLRAANFYDPEYSEIDIPLQTELTPAENAQRYFKLYNKAKRTLEATNQQILQNNDELLYFESVMNAVMNASGESELREIREELEEQGFAKRKPAKKSEKPKKTQPLHFLSSDGFDIYVGKNNKQNDELTLKMAAADDIWLHTKDIPGSHVIISARGCSVPDSTIEEAARMAALFSKAKDSSLVPVDYTLKKHVKKPSGAKPGMVIYKNQKTAYINMSLADKQIPGAGVGSNPYTLT